MIQIPMILNRPAFLAALDGMSDEEIEPIAAAHPELRKCLVPVGADVVAMAAAPVPEAAKEPPKAAPAIDVVALTSAVWMVLQTAPNLRAEDYAANVSSADFGGTEETLGKAVKKILEKFVTDGKAYCEGERRGRRYKPAAPKTEQEEGAAE